MIVASQYGWPAVSDGPMTFYDLLLAAQLMSEERVGKPHRDHQRSLAQQDRTAILRLDRFR